MNDGPAPRDTSRAGHWRPNGVPFYWIPKAAADRIGSELEATERASAMLVYGALCRIAADQNTGTFTISIAFLADRSFVHRRTVERRIPDLERLGLLAVERRRLPGKQGRDVSTYSILELPPLRHNVGTLATRSEGLCVASQREQETERHFPPTPPLPHLVSDVATATPIRDETELPLALPPNGTKRKSDAEDQDFAAFWAVYPRKVAKAAALKAWRSTATLRPPIPELLEKLRAAAECSQWRRDNGQFIPHPATWLNQHRWEDDLQNAQPTTNDTEIF